MVQHIKNSEETTEIIFQIDIALPHIFITIAGKGEKRIQCFSPQHQTRNQKGWDFGQEPAKTI